MATHNTQNVLKRKVIHIVNLWIPLSYKYLFKDKVLFVSFFAIISVLSVAAEIGRKYHPRVKRIFNKWFDYMLKEHELEGQITGASWTFIGVVLVGIIFPKDITIIALLFLHIGDPIASIIGIKFGRTRVFGKTLEGTFAGIIACILIAVPFSSFPLSTLILTAVWTMLMELLPWPVDDNIIIPMSAAGMLWLLG